MAAAGLSGRVHTLKAAGYRDSSDGWWWQSASVRHSDVAFEHPRRGWLKDHVTDAALVLGRRITRNGPFVTRRLHARRAVPAEAGTTVAGDDDERRGVRASAWAAWNGSRRHGGGDTSGPLPVGGRSDYLTLSARAELTVVPGVHAALEGYAGRELRSGGDVAGIDGTLAWRPRQWVEARAGIRHGRTLNTEFDSGATSVELALVLSW